MLKRAGCYDVEERGCYDVEETFGRERSTMCEAKGP